MFWHKFSPYPYQTAEIHNSTYIKSTYITTVWFYDYYNDEASNYNGCLLDTKLYCKYTKSTFKSLLPV